MPKGYTGAVVPLHIEGNQGATLESGDFMQIFGEIAWENGSVIYIGEDTSIGASRDSVVLCVFFLFRLD